MQVTRIVLIYAFMQSLTTVLAAQTLTIQLSQKPVEALAAMAREKGNAVRGAIIQSQQKMGCVNCHGVGNKTLVGPDLTDLQRKLTDVEIIESLLDPSKKISEGYESFVIATTAGRIYTGRMISQTEHEITFRNNSSENRELITIDRSQIEEVKQTTVSNMPEKLLDQLRNEQEFFDLVRYLMEIQTTQSRRSQAAVRGGQSISHALQGLVLIREFNCEACHQQLDIMPSLQAKQAPDLRWSSGRINPAYIQQFIQAPHKTKPGTRMPDLLVHLQLDEREKVSHELTHFIASLSERVYAAHSQSDPEKVILGQKLFHSVGCIACHSPRDESGAETLAVDSVALGKLGQKYSIDSLVEFLENPLASRPSGHMPNMKLSHFEAINLSHYLTSFTPPMPSHFKEDKALVAAGKKRFIQLGCVSCHHVNQNAHRSSERLLAFERDAEGCLNPSSAIAPKFKFSEQDKTAIQAAIKIDTDQLAVADQINVSLTAFRCLNCHQRDELGGVSKDRNPHFQTTNPNLGPQGRIPPTLTNVGAKLRPEWMRQVLVTGRAIRPYQLTRMPQFGASNVEHLIDLFQESDHLLQVEYGTFRDQKEFKKIGTELVGRDGLNCVACHTFQLKDALTMPAVDLTEMADRLHKDWFYHYMQAPQRLSPNTVMPSFWPGGHAIRKDILNGNTNDQIEAIWQYLLDGRQARQPKGLVIEPIELLATDEAVMLRRSYPEVGKRGIGVGYPHQVNLVFDAEQMRLAGIWKGRFADPGGVWRSQGHGRVRPLSRDVIYFIKGPDVDDLASPWIPDEGRPPQHRFRGYSLDQQQRPTFRYEFGEVLVEDQFIDGLQQKTGKPFLDRKLTFSSKSQRKGIRVRLASGAKIQAISDHVYLIDDEIKVHAIENLVTVQREDVVFLEVHLDLPPGEKTLEVRYQW